MARNLRKKYPTVNPQPKKSDKTPSNAQSKPNEKKKTLTHTDAPKQTASNTSLADGDLQQMNPGSSSKLGGGSPRNTDSQQPPKTDSKQEKEPLIPKEISAIVSSITKELEDTTASYTKQINELLTDIHQHKELEQALRDAKLYHRILEHLASLHLSTVSNVFCTFKDAIHIFKEFSAQKARLFDREQQGRSRLEDLLNRKLAVSAPFDEEKFRRSEEAIKKRIRDHFKAPLAAEHKRDFELVSFNHADLAEIERNASARRLASSLDSSKKKQPHLQRKVREGLEQKSFVSIAAPPSTTAAAQLKRDCLLFAQYCRAADLTSLADMYIKGMGTC